MAAVPFLLSRGFLIIAFVLLAISVIVTDPDFFNPKDVLPTAPHHEQLFIVLVVLAGFTVSAPNQTHRLLLFGVALAATLLSISTFIIPP